MKMLSRLNFTSYIYVFVSMVFSCVPVLVEACKAIDHNWDREGENEDPGESTEPSNEFAKKSLWVKIIAYSSNGHQTPPKGF